MEKMHFRPLPLLGNPHVQTILANVLRVLEKPPRARMTLLPLADGDRLAVHESRPRGWHETGATVVLVHGLGGCHQSPYMVRVAQQLLRRAFRVVRVDLRGAGAGAGLSANLYNAACSEDVRVALQWLGRHWPRSPLALLGFSLGGNIVLKLAGEGPPESLTGVAALSAPIDLAQCSRLIERYPFYDRFYVRHLVRQVREQERLRRLQPTRFPPGMTLRQFDDLYTAPRGGFLHAEDYYRKASSRPLIPSLTIPALLLTARDDPFIAVEPFESLPARDNLEVQIVTHGGHLGFLGWDGVSGIRWAERQLVDWVVRLFTER